MRLPQRSIDHPSEAEVCRLYESGVAAVVEIVRFWTSDDWAEPACGDWSRADTVRHLCAVTAWYHAWLDRALTGEASAPFSPSEFAARNQTGIDDRRSLTGDAATARFERDASSYLARARRHWNLPFGFPLGTVTVGLHVGVAATEWHLHAWDLTVASPEQHSPDEPGALFRAAGVAMAEAAGGARGRLTRLVVPIAARRSPWPSMLKHSGRNPVRRSKN